MKPFLAAIVLLVLSGCGFFFGAGYSCKDPQYFAAPPVVVKNEGRYVLRWRYGAMGFYFAPRYRIRDDRLVFSLQGTSSSGNVSGKEQEMLIEGDRAIAALKKGGAFWWEPDGSVVPLAIQEINAPARPD